MSPHLSPVPPVWDWEHDMPPAPAIRAGNTLYLSGQIALTPDGSLEGEGDFVAQSRQCFENIRAILARAGASMRDVVKMTTYFTCGLNEAVAAEYWNVRQAYFGDHKPASTGVQVKALLMPACLVEIEVVAVLPEQRP